MADINVLFCQQLLKGTHSRVREYFPDIKVSEASAIKMSGAGSNKYWFFEYMHEGKCFSHECTADNAYEAKSKGWSAFLRAQGKEE